METFLSVGGFIVGVIGVVLAYIFYRLALREKEPIWAFRKINLFRDNISNVEGLKVLYNDQSVENLSIGKIAFWNKGAATINGQDLTTSSPLRIEAGGLANILDAQVVATNNPSNQLNVTLNPTGNFVLITFDYLDKNQGGVIQLVYTDKSPALIAEEIRIVGDIKGVSKLVDKTHQISFWDVRVGKRGKRKGMSIIDYSSFFSGFMMLLISILLFSDGDAAAEYTNDLKWLPSFFLIGGLFSVSMSIFDWKNRSLLPIGLEAFVK